MKKRKAMAAVLTATAVLAMGSMSAFAGTAPASDSNVTYAQVMEAVEEYQAEEGVMTLASEVATVPRALDWGGVVEGVTKNLTPLKAVRLDDPSTESMAKDAIKSASVEVNENGDYEITVNIQPISIMGITGELNSATLYYYPSADSTEPEGITAVPDDGQNKITFTVPKDAYGYGVDNMPVADGVTLNNMFKVEMDTTVIGIIPMNSTCFVAFNVEG